jgi:hypothetical protein
MEPAERRRLGVELFNHTWTLLEHEDRSERENERMIDAAHASRFFWEEVGEPVHHARSEWQISRVYAVVERPEPALHHARRCLALCEANDIGGFDLAYAHEALARSHAMAGDATAAADHAERGRAVAEEITKKDDRDLVLSDLATLPPVR